MNHAGCGRPLDPPRLADHERGDVGIEKRLPEVVCLPTTQVQRLSAHQETRQVARHIERTSGEHGFVKVVDVEVHEPVVALIGAEVLEVEVAAHPGHGYRIETGVPRPVLPEEMASAAEEGEGTLSHRLVLHRKTLGVAALVEAEDAGCD